MKSFNVIVEDVNTREFIPYDIIPYLISQYENSKNKPTTFKEFKEFIIKEAKYQWWGRCQYEIILDSWPTGNNREKIDVYWQITMNIDIITEIIMEEIVNDV